MQNGEKFMLIAFLSLVKSKDSLLEDWNKCFNKLIVPALWICNRVIIENTHLIIYINSMRHYIYWTFC